jgi:hypothetical protein
VLGHFSDDRVTTRRSRVARGSVYGDAETTETERSGSEEQVVNLDSCLFRRCLVATLKALLNTCE